MMSSEEESSDASKALIIVILLFDWCEFSKSMEKWRGTEEFYSPFIASYLFKQVILSSEERLTKVDSCDREFPFTSVFILNNKEHSVFSSVMKTFSVTAIWIN